MAGLRATAGRRPPPLWPRSCPARAGHLHTAPQRLPPGGRARTHGRRPKRGETGATAAASQAQRGGRRPGKVARAPTEGHRKGGRGAGLRRASAPRRRPATDHTTRGRAKQVGDWCLGGVGGEGQGCQLCVPDRVGTEHGGKHWLLYCTVPSSREDLCGKYFIFLSVSRDQRGGWRERGRTTRVTGFRPAHSTGVLSRGWGGALRVRSFRAGLVTHTSRTCGGSCCQRPQLAGSRRLRPQNHWWLVPPPQVSPQPRQRGVHKLYIKPEKNTNGKTVSRVYGTAPLPVPGLFTAISTCMIGGPRHWPEAQWEPASWGIRRRRCAAESSQPPIGPLRCRTTAAQPHGIHTQDG